MGVEYRQAVYHGIVFTDEEVYRAVGWNEDVDAFFDERLGGTGLTYEWFGDGYANNDTGWVVGWCLSGRDALRPRGTWSTDGGFGPVRVVAPEWVRNDEDGLALLDLTKEILGTYVLFETILVKSVF